MRAKNVQMQEYHNYHYVFVGFATFDKVLKQLSEALPFYTFRKTGKSRLKEIFYDEESHMLSDVGIVLSKSISEKDCYLNFRRLSRSLKKRNTKYKIDKCDEDDNPRDFADQIADAIENSFNASLTIDIEGIVKKTQPIIELDLKKENYDIICGSGYRAKLVYEDALYKDVASGKKVQQYGINLSVPISEERETQELLGLIDKYIADLALYNESRFEIAQKLLYSAPIDLDLEDEESEE